MTETGKDDIWTRNDKYFGNLFGRIVEFQDGPFRSEEDEERRPRDVEGNVRSMRRELKEAVEGKEISPEDAQKHHDKLNEVFGKEVKEAD